MRISDWSSDVCSSDLCAGLDLKIAVFGDEAARNTSEAMALQELFAGTILSLRRLPQPVIAAVQGAAVGAGFGIALARSEEHTSELQSLMRISYAVFCLKKKTQKKSNIAYARSY